MGENFIEIDFQSSEDVRISISDFLILYISTLPMNRYTILMIYQVLIFLMFNTENRFVILSEKNNVVFRGIGLLAFYPLEFGNQLGIKRSRVESVI